MNIHVMVVEDDQILREVIVEALEMEGYRVTSAVNGQDALEKLQTGDKPFLILLDMVMPIMTGREFITRFEKNPKFSDIPVVIVSANANTGNTGGAKGFIPKPPDLDTLLETVRSFSVG